MADTGTRSRSGTDANCRHDLPPENRRALEWLEKDDQQEDEMGEEWWDEFEEFLRRHRLSLGARHEKERVSDG